MILEFFFLLKGWEGVIRLAVFIQNCKIMHNYENPFHYATGLTYVIKSALTVRQSYYDCNKYII